MATYTITLMELIENGFDIGLKNYPIFDENYRNTLNQKIIDHYYTREIGAETASLFKFWLNRRMNEIMPYYNSLYKTTILEFDPLITNKIITSHIKNNTEDQTTKNDRNYNKSSDTSYDSDSTNDYTRARGQDTTTNLESNTREDYTGNKTVNLTENETIDKTETYSEQVHNVFSDTPQNLVNDGYVKQDYFGTTADYNYKESQTESHEESNHTSDTTENETYNKTGNLTSNSTDNLNEDITDHTRFVNHEEGNANENYIHTDNTDSNTKGYEDFYEVIEGLNGFSQSDLLLKYRETLINIDLLIINELKDLFMMVY